LIWNNQLVLNTKCHAAKQIIIIIVVIIVISRAISWVNLYSSTLSYDEM